MMRTGITSGAYLQYGKEGEGFAKMKRHGYDCTDYLDFAYTDNALFSCSDAAFERRVREISDMAKENDIEIYQTHGPWRWPPRDAIVEEREERFEKMSKALWGTRLMNCRYCVIHPMMPFGTEEQPDVDRFFEINLDYFTRLCRVAGDHQVVICLENMPMPKLPLARPAEILDFVKKIDSPWMRVCLDTGHCAVCGVSPADAVRELGREYLCTLHVHDNDGERDRHWLPYTGVIDWSDFSASLQEIGYDGVLCLETQIKGSMPEDIREYQELGLSMMAKRLSGR